MDTDDLWFDLRQGSRNVAGVNWQVAVCGYLLAASRAGQLPFVELIPEGYEDADCVAADGTRTFVQMKELDGGRGKMGPGKLAEALAHAEVSARGAEIVVLTDGSLGSGLSFTGWDSVLSDQSGPSVDKVLAELIDRGYDDVDALSVLARARVVRLPYRIGQASEALLSEAVNVHPSVAGIAVNRLTDVLARASGDQRHATSQTAARVRVSDLDAIIVEVQDAVDVSGLDVAIASGVCAPVSFLAAEEVPARVFYLGVDGRPAHIAANLDVIRRGELLACAEGLRKEGSVLLVGPSGAGKSVLLWRAARDLIPAARVLRVNRVEGEDDARVLARHVRLLRPSETSPVVVVADDLGRPHTTGWPHAAALLREIPSALLLGAARAEDFSPALLVGSTRLIEPQLDATLAATLGKRIREQSIPLRMDPDEAFQRSEGLLMEYIALLTTGQRLRQVLATQVADLQSTDRRIQREAARLVTTAHTLGLTLSADRLGSALADDRSVTECASVGDALGVLRDEHIAVRDGDNWRGLHELRSTTISELLHDNPPPRIGNTLARVAALIHPQQAGWMLRRVAERYPNCVDEVVEALGHSLSIYSNRASDLAAFLEGAERADNALYARATLPILERARPSGLPLEMLATFVYSQRNQNLRFDEIGVKQFDNMARRIKNIANQLPARSDYETTLQAACTGIDSERLHSILTDADLLDAIRILEAGHPHLSVPIDLVRSLFKRMPTPHNVWTATIWSRLAAICHAHLSQTETIEILGPLDNRVTLICAADQSILDAVVDEDMSSVCVTRLLPLDFDEVPQVRLPWDIPGADTKDDLNESTIACLTRLADACPELQRFKITTVTASGIPYRVRDSEPGHKDMSRARFPERTAVRQAVGYQAALRRAISSQTWTEVITAQISAAADLTTAARDLPLRFKPHDNQRRRAAWRAQLADVRRRLGALQPPPLPAHSGPASVHALEDAADRGEDQTTRVLRASADAMDNACSGDETSSQNLVAIAIALRAAADKIDQARRNTRTFLQGRGSVLPNDLSDAMRRSADLATALHRHPELARLISAKDPLPSATEIWKKVTDMEQSRSEAVLQSLLEPVSEVTYKLVEDPNPASWALDSRSWIVMAPTHVLDDTLALLETLDDAAREQLGSHLVVLCTFDAVHTSAAATPAGSDQRVSLGFGYQLSSSAARPALPIPPNSAAEWAQAAGLDQLDHTTSSATLAEQLIYRSHEAARHRMRRLPQPVTAQGDQQPSFAVTDAQRRATDRPQSRESADIQAALSLLQQHVEAEEAGTVSTYLSEVILRPVTGLPFDTQAEELISAMAILQLNSMYASTTYGTTVRPGTNSDSKA
ncbi:hypothetical protein [Dermabacter vaginalis]|nr:hypothetical protein [Dermabacter vaginalis]